MTDEEFQTRYLKLAHNIQSGVAATEQLDIAAVRAGTMTATQPGTSAKMLRSGVNMALIEGGALAHLLINKGIITKEEYQTGLLIKLETEVEMYEAELSARIGKPVKLGL